MFDPVSLFGAGASLLGGIMGKESAEDAADAQLEATQMAAGEQRRQYDQTRTDLQPWRKAGGAAVNQLSFMLGLPGYEGYNSDVSAQIQEAEADLAERIRLKQSGALEPVRAQLGIDGVRKKIAALKSIGGGEPGEGFGGLMGDFGLEDFEAAPGYQFRLGEGAKAVENSAAARGMQLSGPALKGLQRYNQNFASNEYANAFGRDSANKMRKFGFLSGTAGAGQGSVHQGAAAGQSTANAVSDLYTQGGNARAAGIMGGSNALSGAIDEIGSYARTNALLKRYGGR